ncbi:glycosyltransferase family 1 protein [Klebsiella aerogenes]|uniref:glycosyltransferase family 4 protein n=1 Tax=Klebsiella aerogenes TaxID=548 RepID=UPI000C792A87|nr:glycosyltransferase family 1 protein [Klebsiella aerogenes]MDT4310043.1 glycosyltransferase family 1 protein [Klebsiella aerogenes]PLC35179.1 glycosyltransferase family 1 protein [Klebsiella aerogenes]
MKNILIDDRWSGSGGIGTFAEEINKITNYKSAGFTGKPFSPVDCIKTSLKMLKMRDGIVFFPGYIPPLFSRIPFVFTIHDLNHLERPENSSLLKKIFYKVVIKRGCRKAKYIFTVSEFSRQKIIQWSGVPAEKVVNVGNGVSNDFRPNGQKKDLGYPYYLCVSNRKSHKNEIGTIQAFARADIPENIRLVFTGKQTDELASVIEANGLKNRVVFTGFVKTEELPELYRGADGLIFVSFYEGFGLPVIEAMASGIPVITSRTTSLGEVAGDAALVVDPENIHQIATAISKLHHDEDLKTQLIDKGFKQVIKYSWGATSELVNKYLIDI